VAEDDPRRAESDPKQRDTSKEEAVASRHASDVASSQPATLVKTFKYPPIYPRETRAARARVSQSAL
jgi:hypothetical protein